MAEKTYTAAEVGIGLVVAPLLVAVVVAGSIPLTAIQAFVAMKLWNWFVVEYFHFPTLSFWMAFGLLTVKASVTSARHVKGEEFDWKGAWIGGLTAPWITLLLGYLVHLKIGWASSPQSAITGGAGINYPVIQKY